MLQEEASEPSEQRSDVVGRLLLSMAPLFDRSSSVPAVAKGEPIGRFGRNLVEVGDADVEP